MENTKLIRSKPMGWSVDFVAYLIKKFAPLLSVSIARHFSAVSLKSNDVYGL
jgi:hypothetical protein